MIHIALWAATVGLMRGAASVLPTSGTLFLCGPFRRGGRHTAPSNEAFNRDLRTSDSACGVRDLEAVGELADPHGVAQSVVAEMPANAFSLIFQRRPPCLLNEDNAGAFI
jgi:hypothetical protein